RKPTRTRTLSAEYYLPSSVSDRSRRLIYRPRRWPNCRKSAQSWRVQRIQLTHCTTKLWRAYMQLKPTLYFFLLASLICAVSAIAQKEHKRGKFGSSLKRLKWDEKKEATVLPRKR